MSSPPRQEFSGCIDLHIRLFEEVCREQSGNRRSIALTLSHLARIRKQKRVIRAALQEKKAKN
jgi:hypothetical protein